jgi:bacterioferritin
MNTFRADIEDIRRRARMRMEEGAVTASYGADPALVVVVLNEVLATEIVCMLRYKNHYFMAQGIHSQAVADEFLEHAKEEQLHADMVAKRITELGGKPSFDPGKLVERSHAEYRECTTLEAMIREDLVAERIAISTYLQIVRWLGDHDPTSRRMIEQILATEEEHADDLAKLLVHMGSSRFSSTDGSSSGGGNGNGH